MSIFGIASEISATGRHLSVNAVSLSMLSVFLSHGIFISQLVNSQSLSHDRLAGVVCVYSGDLD